MLCQPPSRRSSPRPSRAPLRGRRQWESGKSKPSRSQTSPSKSSLGPHKTPSKTACGATNFGRCDQSNQQYSVTALTDTTGTISERYAYDAYGKLTVLDGGGTVLSGSTYGNRYTYTGREWDEELGLYHYRARMYSPDSGRFVSRDPIGYAATDMNQYRYVFNNTLVGLDPTGNACQLVTYDPEAVEMHPWKNVRIGVWYQPVLGGEEKFKNTAYGVTLSYLSTDCHCDCQGCNNWKLNLCATLKTEILLNIPHIGKGKAYPDGSPLTKENIYGHEQRHVEVTRMQVGAIMAEADLTLPKEFATGGECFAACQSGMARVKSEWRKFKSLSAREVHDTNLNPFNPERHTGYPPRGGSMPDSPDN